MEMETPETPKGGLDRRKLIKRAGIVTAGVAAWSTPMVTSLASRAYAAGSPSPTCNSCAGDVCSGQVQCNDTGPFGFGCFCAQLIDGSGGCNCYANDFCANYDTCTSEADCPSGSTCVLTCCTIQDGPTVGRCFNDCANTLGVRQSPGRVNSGPKGGPE